MILVTRRIPHNLQNLHLYLLLHFEVKISAVKKGNRRLDFDVTAEKELFYGFTRKDDVWFSTSCTLNSWIKPLTGRSFF